MNFNGKPLKPSHAETLTRAVEIHNQFQRNINPDHVDISAETYLEQIIEKQLDGLVEGVKYEEETRRFQRQREEQARRRLNI